MRVVAENVAMPHRVGGYVPTSERVIATCAESATRNGATSRTRHLFSLNTVHRNPRAMSLSSGPDDTGCFHIVNWPDVAARFGRAPVEIEPR